MTIRLIFLSAVVAVAASGADSRLTNVAVRSTAGTGSETLIVGFTVAGTGAKPVLIRGVGPSLVPFGVADAVSDPQLKFFNRDQQQIAENDDWAGEAAVAKAANAVGAFTLPTTSRDAALLESLQPGQYSAHVASSTGSGVALIECYDTETGTPAAHISNVSARSVAGTGSGVLTVGFAIAGSSPKAVLIRGVGPTLANFGVGGALTDPRLRLFDAETKEIANNDDWSSFVSPSAVFTSAGAFGLPGSSFDAVIFLGLPPGTYTAQVSGVGNTTGTALIEVYEVNDSPVPFTTLQPVTSPGGSPPSDPGAGTLVGGGDANPIVTSQARPAYPFELRRAGVVGEVLVDFYVKSDGTVGNAVAIRATDIRFAQSAVAAVAQWLFIPGRKAGRLALTHMQVPIIYTLDEV